MVKSSFRILLCFLLLTIISCSKDKLLESDPDAAYFPLSNGQFSDFDVKRTNYPILSLPEKQHFTTRQTISDSFRDLNDNLVFKMNYFVQNNKSEWKSDSSATVWHLPDKAMSQENGRTIVNQIYPLSNGLLWNGNLYNTDSEEMFRATDIGKPFQTETRLFPKTVTIIRHDDSTLLSRMKYIEIYALNVGLIRKEKIFLKYCNTPDCLGKGIINSGWAELSVIKNYGK